MTDRRVLVVHENPYALEALLRQEVARHAMRPLTQVARQPDGRYAVVVEQYRPLRPRWAKPVAVAGGVVVALGGATATGWWVVSAVPVVLLAALALAVLLLRGHRGSSCTTTVTVTHTHRH